MKSIIVKIKYRGCLALSNVSSLYLAPWLAFCSFCCALQALATRCSPSCAYTATRVPLETETECITAFRYRFTKKRSAHRGQPIKTTTAEHRTDRGPLAHVNGRPLAPTDYTWTSYLEKVNFGPACTPRSGNFCWNMRSLFGLKFRDSEF